MGLDGSQESSEVVTSVQEDQGDVGHVEGDCHAVRKWGILSQRLMSLSANLALTLFLCCWHLVGHLVVFLCVIIALSW